MTESPTEGREMVGVSSVQTIGEHPTEAATGTSITYEISYGKCEIPLYRVAGTKRQGVRSGSTEAEGALLAMEIDVEVFGDNFLAAYTNGDNSQVVATDSMKNMVLREAQRFTGDTPEGFLEFLGQRFLATYPQIEALRLTARERPFTLIQSGSDQASSPSRQALYRHAAGGSGLASLEMRSIDGFGVVTGQRSGYIGLQLLKPTGSSFTCFVRDGYTTLPERCDRPLFIHLDVYWRYGDLQDMLLPGEHHHVSSNQVRDFVVAVVQEFASKSIQHLVHEVGTRLLRAFPQLGEVSLEAQNHTPDQIGEAGSTAEPKIYSAPFPAYGIIKLTLSRNEVGAGGERGR